MEILHFWCTSVKPSSSWSIFCNMSSEEEVVATPLWIFYTERLRLCIGGGYFQTVLAFQPSPSILLCFGLLVFLYIMYLFDLWVWCILLFIIDFDVGLLLMFITDFDVFLCMLYGK